MALTEEQRIKKNTARKIKYHADPIFRAKVLAERKQFFKLQYYGPNNDDYKEKNRIRTNAWHVKKYNSDPEYKAKIRTRVAVNTKNMPIQKYLLTLAKKTSKEKGWECDLELEDIIVPEFCPHCGIKLQSYVGKGNNSRGYDAYSIDRKDSTKRYIKGNVQIVCWRYNDLKKNATIEELQLVIDYMKKTQ